MTTHRSLLRRCKALSCWVVEHCLLMNKQSQLCRASKVRREVRSNCLGSRHRIGKAQRVFITLRQPFHRFYRVRLLIQISQLCLKAIFSATSTTKWFKTSQLLTLLEASSTVKAIASKWAKTTRCCLNIWATLVNVTSHKTRRCLNCNSSRSLFPPKSTQGWWGHNSSTTIVTREMQPIQPGVMIQLWRTTPKAREKLRRRVPSSIAAMHHKRETPGLTHPQFLINLVSTAREE